LIEKVLGILSEHYCPLRAVFRGTNTKGFTGYGKNQFVREREFAGAQAQCHLLFVGLSINFPL
jgi:hypothetical protein